MAATFVNVTEEILKVLVHHLLSNNHQCNYTKTIICLKLSEYYWIIPLDFISGIIQYNIMFTSISFVFLGPINN